MLLNDLRTQVRLAAVYILRNELNTKMRVTGKYVFSATSFYTTNHYTRSLQYGINRSEKPFPYFWG